MMEVKEILQHPFYMALYATILWFVLLWSWAKNRAENGFDSRLWWRRNYDDILLTLMVGFALVIWDDEILDMVNDEFTKQHREFSRWMYMLPGPITSILYKIVTKLFSK